ncbi:hypothetical protein ACIHFE_33135 [Streptomyces sp. NPDC052396]|uniref:hypothetical protein n=1 Tax=Streptomyces sp. NPDC052396 TaxID=3365689 RepID=UPI0037D0E629
MARDTTALWQQLETRLHDAGWDAEVTCAVSPVQIEGSLPSGEPFYFRCRRQNCDLGVGGEDPVCAPEWSGDVDVESEHSAGYLHPDDALDILRELHDRWLAERIKEKLDALSRMTAEHMALPFPPGFRGLDAEGRDMVMLDAGAYGYATSVLKGPLTEQHRAGLTRLMAVFGEVLPAIEDEYATRYYAHVRDMAVLAAEVENLREK